jgi:hypothetical protein
MDRINREREKDLERTEIVTRRYDKLTAECAGAQAGDDDDGYVHSLLSQLNGATSPATATAGRMRQKAVPLELRSAPKGT